MIIGFLVAIATLAYGVVIDCTFYMQLDRYTCYVTKEKLENPNILDAIVGRHKPLKDNYNVDGLILRQSNSKIFYQGIGKFFPNLYSLAWQHGNLKSITARDLEAFPNLKNLDLSFNSLVTLDSDLFKYTSNDSINNRTTSSSNNESFNKQETSSLPPP